MHDIYLFLKVICRYTKHSQFVFSVFLTEKYVHNPWSLMMAKLPKYLINFSKLFFNDCYKNWKFLVSKNEKGPIEKWTRFPDFSRFLSHSNNLVRYSVNGTLDNINSQCWQCFKGVFTNYVDKILAFFDHLPPSVYIFYLMNVDKKWTFLDHLSTHLVL